MRNKIYSLVIVIVVLLAVTACSFDSKKVGWVGNNYPGHLSASFFSFTGVETTIIPLKEGDQLIIEYESEVRKGELAIQLFDPDGEKVTRIATNEKGVEEIVAQKSGSYCLLMNADNARGNFRLLW